MAIRANTTGVQRAAAAIIALVVLAALVLQLVVLERQLGAGWMAASSRFFNYFTILSNCYVVWITGMMALRRPRGKYLSRAWPSIAGSGVLYIAVVGIVYVTHLRAAWDPSGAQLIADVALHYGTPIAFPLFWLVLMPRTGLRWRAMLAWLGFPLEFAIASIIRGAYTGWYPYPFLDVHQNGATRVTLNVIVMTALFTAMAAGIIAVDRALSSRRQPAMPAVTPA